jgi:endonuclease VIII
MPEGDTIFRAARTLERALAGQTVTRFETGLAKLSQIDRNEPMAGRTVERVCAAGKHLLITLSGNLTLRTHMRMNGSWHIYRPGESWQLPRRAMRIVIETADWVAVAFNVYDAEFVPTAKLAHHQRVATLGPDLLGDFDIDRALALVRLKGATAIRDVLLNQRVMAGIGNVYKSEILFLRGIHPDTPANAVSDDAWRNVMTLAQKLLRANVADSSGARIVTYGGLRRTTGRTNESDGLWVYSRGGQPCRKCGTRIASRKDGDDARVTYWCPKCQPPLKHGD